jgi:hypothetical protein
MMRRLGTLLIAGLVILAPTVSSAHKSSKLTVRQRVLSTNQTLERSEARIKHVIKNRRKLPVKGRCTAIIEGRWTHPTTLESRSYKEDWFLKIRKLAPGRKLRASGTIFVEHPELTTDPAWQPLGVTVKTTHCHVRSVGGGGGGDGNCHSSYPTVCIPPPPPDLDCGDIAFKNFKVVGSDPHGFDGDNDGIGCET